MKNIINLLSLMSFLLLFSCAEAIDPIKEFTNGEELRYAGKANDAVCYAGRNRVQVDFKLGPDPNVTKGIIYWNLKDKSVEFDINREALTDDLVSIPINDLEENVYNFEIYTIDKFGNKSVPTHLTGRAYGNRYESSLSAYRQIDDYYLVDPVTLHIQMQWRDSIRFSYGVEYEYTTRSNQKGTGFLANTENGLTLTDIDTYKPFKYRTVFYPEEGALDKFYTETKELIFDPQKSASYELGKPYATYFVEGFDTNNKDFSALWDGKWGKTYSTDNGGVPWATEAGWKDASVPKNSWITVDLGQKYLLSRYRTGFYWPYRSICVKKSELWAYTGTDKPTSEEGWTNWVKLGEVDNSTYIKTQDDMIANYPLGDNFYVGYDNAVKARYYRIKFLDNWHETDNNCNLSEMTFWVYLEY